MKNGKKEKMGWVAKMSYVKLMGEGWNVPSGKT